MVSPTVSEYKPLTDYPGYFAGDNGRIYSFGGQVYTLVNDVKRNSHGYLTVNLLTESGYTVTISVDALVAEAFHGSCPSDHRIVHHNGHKRDNRPVNLSYKPRRDSFRKRWFKKMWYKEETK